MQKNSTFAKQKQSKAEETLRRLVEKLPKPARLFMTDIHGSTAISTQISYAYDFITFFDYLYLSNPEFKKYNSSADITIEDLSYLTKHDLQEYLVYLSNGSSFLESNTLSNGSRSVTKKFSCIRSMFRFLCSDGFLSDNITNNVKSPKVKHDKSVVFLEKFEIQELLNAVESGNVTASAHQKSYCDKTRTRDVALIYLLLGTGIRVAECQGLDLQDIDFRTNSFPVIRKGQTPDTIFFNNEVAKVLSNYIEGTRNNASPLHGHEEALFLSMQNRRMSIDAIESVVKKYTKIICSTKNITVHKLRSTFATRFFKHSGNDLIATQHALGHANPNTTSIYTGQTEDDKKKARSMVLKSVDNPHS